MRHALTAALLLAAVAALGRAADDKKADRDALVGTWSVVEYRDDGNDRLPRLTGTSAKPAGDPTKLPRLVFTADECYLLRPGKKGGVRDVLAGLTNVAWKSCTLDEKAKTIDIVAADKPGSDKKVVYFGIYELEGKRLRVCWNESGRADAKRPTKFESDGEMNLLVCERLADEPEKPTE